MLVTCDKCGKSYQVNEAKLPPQGARMKCQNCQHIMIVRLGGESAEKAASEKVNNAAAQQSEPAADQNAQENKDEITWKIRQAGLTYTFHTLVSLQDWLKGRTSVEDVKVAKGDDDWKELGDYSEVLTTELITRFFPLGDVPRTPKAGEAPATTANEAAAKAAPVVQQPVPPQTNDFGIVNVSKNTMKNVAKARSEQNRKKRDTKNGIMAMIVVILCTIAILFSLNYFGVVNLFPSSKPAVPAGSHIEYIDGVETIVPDEALEENNAVQEAAGAVAAAAPAEAKPTEPVVDSTANSIDKEEAQKLIDEKIEKLLSKAREHVKKKDWPVAQTILIGITKEYPENIEAKELLIKTYRGLRQGDKADALEAEVKKLKENP